MDFFETYKVVPVVVINKLEDTQKILQALEKGGLPIAEITFRTDCAKAAIEFATKKFPNMLIGAGTVINESQANSAIQAGAKFIVSPGYESSISKVCKEKKLPYFPGCVTPTEIISAINDGWKIIKFFPANIFGGLKAMKSLSGPFPQIKFIPTGGIDATNLAEYLAWDKIHAVGGSWMMKGDENEIIAHCQKITNIVKEVK